MRFSLNSERDNDLLLVVVFFLLHDDDGMKMLDGYLVTLSSNRHITTSIKALLVDIALLLLLLPLFKPKHSHQ